MFFPRYSYHNGLVRPARKRVAAVSKKANIGSGGLGGLMGAGGGFMQAYSPVYERAEDPTLVEEFLPSDTQTQNKIFRNIIMYDPVAGPATEYWRDLAFSRYIRLGGMKDEKILQFYQDAIQASNIEHWMPWMLNDYLTFGRFVSQFNMDERKGYWTDVVIHDLDFVEIIVPPFTSDDPVINVQPNNEHRNWAVSRDPRVVEQRANYDPEVIKLIAMGDPYPLPAEHTMFMPRKAYGTDYYGTSYLTRIIPFKIMEKALIDAEVQAARRRAGPVWIIKVPEDYEADEIQEIIDQFFAVEEDPVGGKVAVREGVDVSPIGGGKQDFWTMSEEYDFLRDAKLNALGLNASFLDGSATLASMEKTVEIFVEKLRSVRNSFTERIVIDKMLKGLARMHGYVQKPSKQVAHHYRIAKREISDADLLLPSVEWDKPLEPQADLDYWDLLERLEQKGIPIPKRRWAQAAGYDFDETIESAEADMDDRAKLYQIKSAQAKQAEKAGFDLEGNVLAGGEIGGGPGGLDLGGPGEFELGPGEEFEMGGEPGGLELGPPAEAELPAAEVPEAGEGAGASLVAPRFPVNRNPTQFRYAMPTDYRDLEQTLKAVDIWDQNGFVMQMSRRRVAQALDKIAHQPPEERHGRFLTRLLRKDGLNDSQAGVVQYCAARLGFMPHPYMGADTIRYLQHVLVDKANQSGLTQHLNREMELFTRAVNARTKIPVAGPRNVTAHQLKNHEILTGVL